MTNTDLVWQDREIRFDINQANMNLRGGESLVESLKHIEDSKGNAGEEGSLKITNLRIIWFCNSSSKINLSIGFF